MQSIQTEAGQANIAPLVGRVEFNGRAMLPHEAHALGLALQSAANAATDQANNAAAGSHEAAQAAYVAKYVAKGKGGLRAVA